MGVQTKPECAVEEREIERLTLWLTSDGYITEDGRAFLCRDDAVEALCAFRSDNWTNRMAFASLWSWKLGKYVETWQGGVTFGCEDTRHPLERLFHRAIKAGLPVTLIDQTGTYQFNRHPVEEVELAPTVQTGMGAAL